MKMKEILLDWVIQTPLFEMAVERKILLDKVRNLQDVLCSHLIKVLALDMPENIIHWIQEINGIIGQLSVYKLKGHNNRTLSSSDFYSILWNEPLGDGIIELQNHLKALLLKGYPIEKRTKLNDAQVYEALEKIYHNLSYDLANRKTQSIQHYLSTIS